MRKRRPSEATQWVYRRQNPLGKIEPEAMHDIPRQQEVVLEDFWAIHSPLWTSVPSFSLQMPSAPPSEKVLKHEGS